MLGNDKIIISITLFLLTACVPKHHDCKQETINIQTKEEMNIYLEKAKEQPDNIAVQRAIWRYYTTAGDANGLIRYAVPIYEKAVEAENTELAVMAGAHIGQTYGNINQYDSMFYYFDRVTKPAKENNMLLPLTLIYNSLAIYEIKIKIDHNKSIEYFHLALDTAKKAGDENSYGSILSNLAATYHLRNDPDGLEYALEAYQLAVSSKNSYQLLYAALNTAQMYCVCKDYEEALRYIETSLKIVERDTEPGHQYRIMVYSVYAEILSALGRDDEAEKYYKSALSMNGSENIHTYSIMAFLGYGNLLLTHNRYDEAVIAFEDGARLCEDRNNYELLPQFYGGLSDSYENMGRIRKAFDYYKQTVVMRDSIFNLEKERELSRLSLQYEKSCHEQELQKKELHYVKQKKATTTVIFILLMLLLIISMAYFISRKKSEMYRKLVEKHQKLVRQAQELRNKADTSSVNDSKIGSLTEEKGGAIFKHIEHLFREEHIYRHNDISLAYISELLNTNQWYVSRIINEYAKMSFSNYINSYRIDEAVSILSDINNDTPLKALSDYLGYNSISAFYRSFQKETGVPPSKYRTEVRCMSDTDDRL